MDKIVCIKCGDEKPEIAFELNRGGTPRKKCRVCRAREKEESHRRRGDLRRSRPRSFAPPFVEATW